MGARVAAIQLRGDGTLKQNLARTAQLIADAAADGADLVVLPENFAYYGERDLLAAARLEQDASGPARGFLADQAAKHGVWLLGGTLPLFEGEDDVKPYAASLLLNPGGEEFARYNKIHLFDVDVAESGKSYRESDDYRHGAEPVVVPTPVGKLGLTVCYDLRFPELFRQLVDAGAEIVAVPSAFTATTGEAHWQLLLRARAVENLCYMVGADLSCRDHPMKPCWGGSAIIDPWGGVLAELDSGEGVICTEVDAARLARLRRNMPVLEHRRFKVVKGG